MSPVDPAVERLLRELEYAARQYRLATQRRYFVHRWLKRWLAWPQIRGAFYLATWPIWELCDSITQ